MFSFLKTVVNYIPFYKRKRDQIKNRSNNIIYCFLIFALCSDFSENNLKQSDEKKAPRKKKKEF